MARAASCLASLPLLAVVLVCTIGSPRPLTSAKVVSLGAHTAQSPQAIDLADGVRAEPFLSVAALARQRDFVAIRQQLEPLTREDNQSGRLAQLLLGFYAHAFEDVGLAERWLLEAGSAQPLLEDWRLYTLADVAAAGQKHLVAQAALARLLKTRPDSPLRHRTLQRAAHLAWQQGQPTQALELIAQALEDNPETAIYSDLHLLRWTIASAVPNARDRLAAGRDLLVHLPIEASKLGVIELFRAPTGELAWSKIFSSSELETRARSLLAADLPQNAWDTLQKVADPQRDAAWDLLAAEILVELNRGGEAVALLDRLPGDNKRRSDSVNWLRARALLEASESKPNRYNLSVTTRAEFRSRARALLLGVGNSQMKPTLAVAALELLFQDLADEPDRFETVLQTLTLLRHRKPTDTTGARYLWQHGWSAFDRRNHNGAIGYWRELTELYPESSYSRAGSYWIGRAYDRLGHVDRAIDEYRGLVQSDTTDFYRKYALKRLRLRPSQVAPSTPVAVVPWPSRPELYRARLLTDLGLDQLALSELALLPQHDDPRAANALRSRILARTGERRESIRLLRSVFRSLGSPHQASIPQDALEMYYPVDYQAEVLAAARDRALSPYVVFAMIRQESAFDARAQSWAGARGLMQLMPATGKELARKLGLRYSADRLLTPDFSVRLGTAYFRQVLDMFDGNTELALAGYNSGPYRMKRWWSAAGKPVHDLDRFLEDLPREEPKTYVKRIVLFADSYQQLYPFPG